MATDETKKRIMEHLAKSSDTMKSVSVKKTTKPNTPPTPPPPKTELPEPTPVKVDKKRQILDHVSRSGSDVGKFSQSEEQRKKRIQDHVRKSKS